MAANWAQCFLVNCKDIVCGLLSESVRSLISQLMVFDVKRILPELQVSLEYYPDENTGGPGRQLQLLNKAKTMYYSTFYRIWTTMGRRTSRLFTYPGFEQLFPLF